MKKRMAMSIGCLLVVVLSGCCNYLVRTKDKDLPDDWGKDAPCACAPHPYFCTAEVWQDVALSREYHCGLAAGFAIMMWPFCVVDEVCEVVFDTVFLPVDLMYLFMKKDICRCDGSCRCSASMLFSGFRCM